MTDDRRQLELFAGDIAATVDDRGDRSEPITFAQFHKMNPHVYAELRKLALFYVGRGRKRLSIKLLFEILRSRFVETTGGGRFRLNNSYSAYYARLLMEQEPELDGVFDIRESKRPLYPAPLLTR